MLLEHGADPNARVESSGTPMSQAAQDPELTALLHRHGGRELTSDRDRVRRLVHDGRLEEAERLLRANPQWIHDDIAGWGDGILAGPAHDGRHDGHRDAAATGRARAAGQQMGALLLLQPRSDGCVPALLLERGADPVAAGAPWATPPVWAEKKEHRASPKCCGACRVKGGP